MARRITHYTTLTRFGGRPVFSVAEVMADLGIESRHDLPKSWKGCWPVYQERGA